MRKSYLSIKRNSSFTLLTVVFLICFSEAKAQQVFVDTYTFTGAVQTFTVPSCVSTITLEAWGAQGGTNTNSTVVGGLGGYATGILNVNQGDVLYIYVGGKNGYNGGGAAGAQPCTSAMGASGGGASDVRFGGTTFANRVIVGGGGGGAGGDRIAACGRGAGGGGGGGYYGGGGGAGWTGAAPGGTVASPGTQTSGGSGGTSIYATINNGLSGILGVGGDGGQEVAGPTQGTPSQISMPGGGGGGLSGDFGAMLVPTATGPWAGQSGAGGSSYLGTLLAASTTSVVRSGNGQIKFSYTYMGAGVSVAPSATSICMGQNVSLTAGGVLSYTWFPVGTLAGSNSTNVNDTPATTTSYTVQGTNSIGCISESVVTIYVGGDPINVNVSNPVICAGQSSTLVAGGANSYNWSSQNGGFSTVTTGTLVVNTSSMSGGGYDIIGADSLGCNSPIASITITVLSPAAAISGPSITCKGNYYTLSASGADTYTWNTGSNSSSISVSPNVNTVYTLIGGQSQSNVSCYSTASLSIMAYNSPGVGAISNHNIICSGESVMLTAIGATNYTWTNGVTTHTGSAWQVNPISNQTISSQVYTVTGSNQYDCSNTATIAITVNPCTGIAENNGASKISIYPNPNKGEFVISTAQTMEIRIINEVGQVVKTIKVDGENTNVKLDNLRSGIYFIVGKGEQGTVKEKIIVEK